MKKSQAIYFRYKSTLFLRLVVVILGVIALFFAGLAWVQVMMAKDDFADPYRFVLLGLELTVIPFFIALHQTLKLLHYVDTDKAFSELSVRALNRIKYCALVFSALYAVCLPVLYVSADGDSNLGVMFVGFVMIFAPIVIAVFAAVLQKLLQNAIAIKSENDLTV